MSIKRRLPGGIVRGEQGRCGWRVRWGGVCYGQTQRDCLWPRVLGIVLASGLKPGISGLGLGLGTLDDFAQDGAVALLALIEFLCHFPDDGFGSLFRGLGDVDVRTADADGITGLEDSDLDAFAVQLDSIA